MFDYSGLYDSVKRDPVELQRKIAGALRVTEQTLHQSMLRQAQTFASWGAALALAERDAKLKKAEVEEVILPTARVAAETFLLNQGRKVTVQAKDDVARADPTYVIARTDLIEQQTVVGVIKSTVEALRQKMNMMQSLNSRQKAELTAIPVDSWDRPGDVSGSVYTDSPDKSSKTMSEDMELSTELSFLKRRYRAQKRSDAR